MFIYKEISGKGDDIVLLHGWATSHYFMEPIGDKLEKNYKITNIDLPGNGLSEWDDNTQCIYDFVEQILPVLPEKATYIGWSFGGCIAIALAKKYPERVKKIINLTSTPKFLVGDNWPGIEMPGFSSVLPDVKNIGLWNYLEDMYSQMFKVESSQEAIFKKLENWLALSKEPSFGAFERGLAICDKTDLREELRDLHCEIDFILGGKDDVIPIMQHEELNKLNPEITIHCLSNEGHFCHITNTDEVIEYIHSLLV